MLEVEHNRNEMQPDTGHKNGSNRHECYIQVWSGKLERKDRALIFAEQLFDALECNRIDVPGIAGNISHDTNPAVTGCVKPMVHAGAKTKRHELSSAMPLDYRFVLQQILHAVR